MSKRGFRRVAVFASSAALAGGALVGCGCGRHDDHRHDGNATTQQQSGQPPQGGGGMDFTALAKTLGVTTEKLQAAMEKNRAGCRASRPGRTARTTWPPTSRRNSASRSRKSKQRSRT